MKQTHEIYTAVVAARPDLEVTKTRWGETHTLVYGAELGWQWRNSIHGFVSYAYEEEFIARAESHWTRKMLPGDRLGRRPSDELWVAISDQESPVACLTPFHALAEFYLPGVTQ